MRATNEKGQLQELVRFKILTPYPFPYDQVKVKILPEISDSKSATYNNDPIPGRTTAPTAYSHSDPRTVQTDLTFMVTTCQDIEDNIRYKRIIESLVYPGPATGGVPYKPPAICKIICGKVLGDNGICAVLKSYNYRSPVDIAWDEATYLPYRFTMSCSWEVVYACSQLPTNNLIYTLPFPIDWTCPSLP